jgi:lipid II:glycine glycyltransferase (peptidoglycan interpeptide bridge formation enzyme)
MRILKGKDIITDKWEQLYKSSSFATFFQSPDCYRFYKELSFMSPFVYAVEEEGMIKALVCGYLIAEKGFAKSYFSRRAIIPGGLLLANDISEEALELLLSELRTDLQRKAIYIELRNLHDYSTYKAVFVKLGFKYEPHLNFQMDIVDSETLWKKLSDNRKREIKISENLGAVCVEAHKEKDIIDFYLILSELYSKKIKTPIFPLEFFLKLCKNPFSKIFVVKFENKVIGGIVCILDSTTVYEWFICGNDNNIKVQTMATWTAINFTLANGLKRFDFMGAGSPLKEYGVREYKSRFGAVKVEHGRFQYIFNPFIYSVMRFLVELIKG